MPHSIPHAISIGLFALGCLANQPERPLREDTAASPAPLARTHSHNDYERPRPLEDALSHGFCSVEADIHLVQGQLLVAHDLARTKPNLTLENLYLKPLRERTQQNGGRIYRHGPSVILLIDIKTEAEPTYAVLKPLLEQYAGILTRFSPGKVETNAVTVIISGNRPRSLLTDEGNRLAAWDGRLEDLNTQFAPEIIPLLSDNWTRLFSWKGPGEFPPKERAKLQELVRKTHEQRRQIRFWAAPDQPAAWKELAQAGVDLINTDDLTGLSAFLTAAPLP